MRPLTKTKSFDIYQIKITLKGSQPPIWRRILVRSNSTLEKLHSILQVIMPWDNGHLHQFIFRDTRYTHPEMMGEWGEDEDEREVTLGEVAPRVKTRFIYEYDFGDGWEHEILVEKILPPQPGVRYPICLKGARACPPDDCGGIWGYYDLLEALQNPGHPEHDELMEWAGGAIDPEAFHLEAVNNALKRIRS